MNQLAVGVPSAPCGRMKAAVVHSHGLPSVFVFDANTQPPALSADQVLVRIKATSVNPADAKQRSGNLRLVLKHTFPLILGQDFAGTVEAVGARCRRFAVGDQVYGSTAPRNGCSAELVAVFERECCPKPKSLSWLVAAATPTVAATAYKGIVTLGNAASGQRVLIHGAAGGVGSAAAQIALARGCHVTGTCSEHNAGYVTSLGCRAVRYEGVAFDREMAGGAGSFDLVFDAVGGEEQYVRSLPLMHTGGRYVSAVGPVLHGGSEPITVRTIAWTASVLVPRMIRNLWARVKYTLYLSFEVEDLACDELRGYIESSRLRVRVDPAHYTLETIGAAHTKIETGHSEGKLVVQVDEAACAL